MKNLVKGIASFEGEEATNMVAYCDLHKGWNGWAMPYIHADFIPKFISFVSTDENNYQLEGESLHVINSDDGVVLYDGVIEPTIIEGEKYYNLGFEGLCFDFEPLEKDNNQLAIVVDIEGLIYDDEEVEENPLRLGEIVSVEDWGYNKWQVYVKSKNAKILHGIDTERIILL
jgi:hypothetical protein